MHNSRSILLQHQEQQSRRLIPSHLWISPNARTLFPSRRAGSNLEKSGEAFVRRSNTCSISAAFCCADSVQAGDLKLSRQQI
jgi:hypothetical protein